MIRTLRAFIWLRWRLIRNGLSGGRQRDAIEQVSRALAMAVPLVLFALSLGSVLGVGAMALLGARGAALGKIEPILLVFIVRVLLVVAFALVVLLAAAAPVQSNLSRYTRLLLLPIPRQSLHVVEVLANLADPWLGIFVVGLLLLPVGLALGHRSDAAAWALPAGLATLATLALAGSITSFLVSWLVRNRRRGEMLTLVFVLGISLFSFVPLFLTNANAHRRAGAGTTRPPSEPFSIDEFDRALPVWTHALPSELYARVLDRAFERDHAAAVRGVGWLWVEVAGFFVISSLVHRTLLNSVESHQAVTARARSRDLIRRIPGTSQTVSAVALAQMHTALRTVRGRFAVLLPGPLVGLMMLATRRLHANTDWSAIVVARGEVLLAASLIFAIYALQAFTMNLFAIDRSGLTLQFLSPIRDDELARGKTLGLLLVFTMSAALCTLVITLVSPRTSPVLALSVLAGGYATFLLLWPIGVWLSALLPVAADLSKTGPGGNPHPVTQLAGTLLVLIFAVPAALILIGADFWLHRPMLALPAMLLWLGIVVAVVMPLVRLASRAIGPRRENLALVAQGR